MAVTISISMSLSVQDLVGAFHHGRQLHNIRRAVDHNEVPPGSKKHHGQHQ